MKQFNLFMLFFLSFTSLHTQIVGIESDGSGVVFPRMSSTDRLNINVAPSEDGLLVYDSTEHYFYYFSNSLEGWVPLKGQGSPGIEGPEGPIGRAGIGQQGPKGLDGISCWDSNANREQDLFEDVNRDGMYDYRDCGVLGPRGIMGPQGDQGPDGDRGPVGDVGPAAISFSASIHTADAANTSGSESILGVSATSVFIENIDHDATINPYFDGTQWVLKTQDGSDFPTPSSYKIIAY